LLQYNGPKKKKLKVRTHIQSAQYISHMVLDIEAGYVVTLFKAICPFLPDNKI